MAVFPENIDHPARRAFLKWGLRLGGVVSLGLATYDLVSNTGPLAQQAVDEASAAYPDIRESVIKVNLNEGGLFNPKPNPKNILWEKIRRERGISRREGIDALGFILGGALITSSIPDWFKPIRIRESNEDAITQPTM